MIILEINVKDIMVFTFYRVLIVIQIVKCLFLLQNFGSLLEVNFYWS